VAESTGRLLNCDCLRCGSKRTRALKVIHQEGTRDAVQRRQGWFAYRGHLGLTGSVSHARSQSLAALTAAPHVPPVTQFLQSGIVPVVLIACALIWGGPGLIAATAGLVGVAVVGGWHGAEGHAQAEREWSDLFRCGRCGQVFSIRGSKNPESQGSNE
jgi:hypothetical protein